MADEAGAAQMCRQQLDGPGAQVQTSLLAAEQHKRFSNKSTSSEDPDLCLNLQTLLRTQITNPLTVQTQKIHPKV